MKLRHTLVAVALCAAAIETAMASPHTITWSAQNPGAALGDSNGDELAPGAILRLGYFAISPEDIAASFDDVPYLEGQFTEVSREEIGNFGGIVYGELVERVGSGLDVAGAFAQTITLDSESLPAGTRFYIWVSDHPETDLATAQGIFSSSSWQLTSEQVTAVQWGVENVAPAVTSDVYLADLGPETSATVGGMLNKLRKIDIVPVGPGDLEDPDGNGIVVLLEEAFLIEAGAPAYANMPRMTAADVLVYNRVSGGEAIGWDVYRADDLEYTIEISSDFRNWQRASEVLGEAGISAESRDTGGERVAVKLPVAPGLNGDAYFRLHVRRVAADELP